jgi:hypothetical protein
MNNLFPFSVALFAVVHFTDVAFLRLGWYR